MAFTQKRLRFIVQLATNSQTNQPNQFAGKDSNAVTLDNHRASVRVVAQGAAVGSSATVRIWGLAPNLMVELSTLGLNFNVVPRNLLTILAGDAAGMATVFSGTIIQAYGDYRSQPDVPMVLVANAGAFEDATGTGMASYPNPVNVADVIKDIAGKIGYGSETNDVNVMLRSGGGSAGPSFKGSPLAQARAAAEMAHVQFAIVNGSSGLSLAIWPWEGTRSEPPVPTIQPGPNGGLISYPIFTPNGVEFENIFNPQIQMGGKVKVNSSLLNQVLGAQKSQIPAFNVPPNSEWAVNQVDLALDSRLPRGMWQQTVYCWNPGQGRPTVTGTG